MMTNSHLPLKDRIPTFDELNKFDAGAAWDRLSPDEQRMLGMLAVRYGTIGHCGECFRTDLDSVRNGVVTAHWTAEAQAAAVWPTEHVDFAEHQARTSFDDLNGFFDDKVWPKLWGWTPAVTLGLAIATIINALVTIGGVL